MARDVNNNGVVVGAAAKAPAVGVDPSSAPPVFRAFSWQNGRMANLGTLGGDASEANAINDYGVVVGASRDGGGKPRAFVYEPVSGMQELEVAGDNVFASDVNNEGQIVGTALFGLNDYRAFLYQPQGGSHFLDDLVTASTPWTKLTSADSINNRGQILGNGIINGELHVFLATPTSEPTSGATMIVLLTSSLLLRRRLTRCV